MYIDMNKVAEIEREYDSTVVAVAFDSDGAYDHCFNWETAQNMALSEGYRIVAIADDPHAPSMTKERIQALCDAEKNRHDDCFGIH